MSGKSRNPPIAAVERFAEAHFHEVRDRAAFLEAMGGGNANRPCLLWTGDAVCPFPEEPEAGSGRPGWIPRFVVCPAKSDASGQPIEPGKHPLHRRGAYYCLDRSSVFAAAPLTTIDIEAPRVLDVCASPGGKSIFAHLALQPEALVANEVIGKRLAILRHNLKRCRIRCFTQRLDVAELAILAKEAFDVVLVDAPCSGQSLLARGIENPGCFHRAVVNKNVRRQRRILARSAATVFAGGYLLYTTCTFSVEENERVIAWLLKKRPDFEALDVPALDRWRSAHAGFPCYRLYPQHGMGAGAFSVLLKRIQETDRPAGERDALAGRLLEYPVLDRDEDSFAPDDCRK